MHLSSADIVLILTLLRVQVVKSLDVTPNSPCSDLCMDNPNHDPTSATSPRTYTSDLSCNDWELTGANSTSKGRKFKQCLICESNSTAHDPSSNENDVQKFLSNIRFTINACVFTFPMDANQTTASSNCGNICGGSSSTMRIAMIDKIMQTPPALQYQYCDNEDGAFLNNYKACTTCLETVPSSQNLVNYLSVMDVACQQRPTINGNTTIKLDFDLYSTSTSPSISSKTSVIAANASMTAAATNSIKSASPKATDQRLGLGIGLGLGVGLLVMSSAIVGRRVLKRKAQCKSQDKRPKTQGTLAGVRRGRDESHTGQKPVEVHASDVPEVPGVDYHRRGLPELPGAGDVPELTAMYAYQ